MDDLIRTSRTDHENPFELTKDRDNLQWYLYLLCFIHLVFLYTLDYYMYDSNEILMGMEVFYFCFSLISVCSLSIKML